MAKSIEPSLKLISDYLKLRADELFVIPEYQRRYSWTVLECDKLWQDIESYMDSETVNESGQKEPYFFGTIIADCSKQDQGKINLIDGQQRTTTFILLMKALLLRIQEILKATRPDADNEALLDGLKERRNVIIDILYRRKPENRREFLNNPSIARGITILQSKSINELDAHKKDFQTIVEACDFKSAQQECYKIPRKRKDNQYTYFFRNFKFFFSRLSESGFHESKVNAFARTFLEECQIIEIRSWNTEQAITMFNSLNSTGMPLADSDIISAQLYSNSRKEDKLDEFIAKWGEITRLVNDLSERKIASMDSLLQQLMYILRAERKEYVSEGGQPDVTTPGLRSYYTIKNKEILEHPMMVCERIERLAKIWDMVAEDSIVKLLLKFNENAKLYLISFLNRYKIEELADAPIVEITKCLIKLFAILEVVDAGYSSAKFKTFLFGENIKLVDKSVSIKEIERDFCWHILKWWKEEEIQLLLLEYDKNILVFLNEYLYAENHNIEFNFSESTNIEHIMPSSGRNRDSICHDAGIETHEEFLSLVNKLGNKILLEEEINKSLGNDWFRTKKQKSIRDKRGYNDSSYGIARALTRYPRDVWTKTDIEKSTQKAVRRIADFIFSK